MTTQFSERTSLLVPSQLPEFISGDENYENFVSFIQAYYEWMEQNNETLYNTKKLPSYVDIDTTIDDFVQYFIHEFLPFFPEEMLSDKRKVIKLAKELYTAKGTEKSYKLLFRLLYDSDVDVTLGRDLVLRASSGEWFIPKYLNIKSDNTMFSSSALENYSIFGETSKSFAVIERGILDGAKYDVFISDIERVFVSGEIVRVVDVDNQDIYSKDGVIVDSSVPGSATITGKIVGVISNIDIDAAHRGLNYKIGDPVIVYGGLNEITDHGATAQVSETTQGAIARVSVFDGGYGYQEEPNTVIVITPNGGAIVNVATLDISSTANITFLPIDVISLHLSQQLSNSTYSPTANSLPINFNFPNIAISNLTTTLANAFTFVSITTHPISSVAVNNGGAGFTQVPDISAYSTWTDELGDEHDISELGILSNIIVNSAGLGYAANDKILFSGGAGCGAFANVKTVGGSGQILTADYVYDYTPNNFLVGLGGRGYDLYNLPTLSVVSGGGANASLSVNGILGQGAIFSAVTDRIGAITRISLIDTGEDYISKPNVSLKIQDLAVTSVSDPSALTKETLLFQGADPDIANSSPSYYSYIYSSSVYSTDILNPNNDVYIVRTYNYNKSPDGSNTIYINAESIVNANNPTMNLTTSAALTSLGYISGVKTYGDSTARATSRFLQGLTLGQGFYINKSHQPSSYSLLQSKRYNDYSYEISVNQHISKYRDILKSLLHPAGMKMYGKFVMRSKTDQVINANSAPNSITSLQYRTNWPVGNPWVYATMKVDVANNVLSTNTVTFNELRGAPVSTILAANDYIRISDRVYSQVKSFDDANGTITLVDNVFLTFPNVAYAYASSNNSDIITYANTSLTSTPNYDIINNKNYSDPNNHMKDIVFVGDNITINGNTYVVSDAYYTQHQIRAQGLTPVDTFFSFLITEDEANTVTVTTEIVGAGDQDIIFNQYLVPQFDTLPFTINRTISTPDVSIYKSY